MGSIIMKNFHSVVKENIVKPTWRETCLLEIQLFRSLLGPSSGINESGELWTIYMNVRRRGRKGGLRLQ